jgi:flagellar hook-associated protein 2
MAISSTTASTGSAFNVDGIVSGLKTADIIAQMMKLSQAPLNQLTAQQAAVQKRDDAYQAISAQMLLFRGSVQNLLLSNAVNAKLAASSAPTVATATANATAVNGSFSVNVIKLATATSATSSGVIGAPSDLSSGTMVSAAGLSIAPTAGVFTVNGHSVTLGASDTWATLQASIATATAGAVTLNLGANGVSLTSSSPMQLGSPTDSSNILSAANLLGAAQTSPAGVFTIASSQLLGEAQTNGPLSSAGLNVAGGLAAGGSFQVNGVSINWSNTDSLTTVLTRINSSSAGVTATYDPKQDKVSLTNSNTGAQSISLVDTAGGNLLQALHLTGASSNGSLGGTPDLNPATAMSAAGLTLTPTAGTFTINGQTVTVGASDTWATVQSSISTATGGLVTLNLGSSGVSLSSSSPVKLGDPADTSNLLVALNLVSATQASGVAAEYKTTQNGVESLTQYSNSNTVSGVVQGVGLTLLTTGTTTISATQNTTTAATNLGAFVTQFNSMVDLLDTSTRYDPITNKGAVLTGDSAVRGLATQLRSLVTQAGLVPAGSAYRTMGDIGISTGAYGSALGSTNHLILDTTKLAAALQNNPQAVSQVLSGLTGTTSSSVDIANPWMATATGTPFGQVSAGSYKISFNPVGNKLTSVFTSSNGTIQPAITGTITAGGTNTTLIPGMSLVALGTLPTSAGTDTVNYTVTGRGILQTVSSYINQARSASGIFSSEHNNATSSIASFSAQIARQNQLLAQRQTSLQAQFTAMEVALTKLQSQSSSLASSLSSLSNSQSSSSGN